MLDGFKVHKSIKRERETTSKQSERAKDCTFKGDNMELKETIDLMCSSNYKERFIAEYRQTKIRYEQLKNFCNKIEVETMLGKEVTKHDCPLQLLREQQKYMGLYLSILEKRALIENIKLEDKFKSLAIAESKVEE